MVNQVVFNLVACNITTTNDKIYNFSLSILTVIFPDEPGLASFIEAMDDGKVVVTTGAISRAKLHHILTTTNKHPTFHGPDDPVAQPTVSKH